MGEPHVPGSVEDAIELPCGTSVSPNRFDMGMREIDCPCGDRHAVVMDVHPLGRWVPESIVAIFEAVVDPADEYDVFGTIHLMGIVLEEFPDQIAVHDASQNPSVGWALLWVTAFDARSLHEVIVELLVELMDHAVSHSDDPSIQAAFDDHLATFDVEAFVEEYRAEREFEDERDRPL